MVIDVDPDWWKTLFDEVYLITDARSVGDETITGREVDAICELLHLEPGHRILDFCGGHGRHTFELCKRGFKHCTLFDYSKELIRHARSTAYDCDYGVEMIQGDARSTDLPSDYFDHVIVMGNSLGYIQDPHADSQILAEAHRVLKPGGRLLADVSDGNFVRGAFVPNAWHEIGKNTVVCRQRELRGNTVVARELVIDKQIGLVRDQTYAIRLYDSDSLTMLLHTSGFGNIKVYTNFSSRETDADYGFMNHRMLGIGQKPEAVG